MRSFLAGFKQQATLTYIYGIPVRIDYRWFPVFILLSWVFAISIPNSIVGNFLEKYLFGFFSVLILFVSIFLHEFAHTIIAKKEGIGVIEILLHPFGGLARFRIEPDSTRAEFRIAIAGPIVSFIIAIVFLVLYFLIGNSFEKNLLTSLFFILFYLNLLIAIFNILPGYPLDGGRVLRSILWRSGTDLNEATVLTGKFGQVIAVSLILFGIAIIFVSRDIVTGVWTIVIGTFLFDSAYGIIREVYNFEKLIAEEVMELPIPIKPEKTIKQFVDKTLPMNRYDIFPVADKRKLFGVLLLKDIKSNFPREKWHEIKIRDAMRPIQDDYFIDTKCTVVDAKEMMRINGIGVLGVINKDDDFVGFIRRGRIRRRN